MSAGPLFWTEYVDEENNKYTSHQAAVIQVDMDLGKALILVPKGDKTNKARTVRMIDLDKILWARWD